MVFNGHHGQDLVTVPAASPIPWVSRSTQAELSCGFTSETLEIALPVAWNGP